MPSFNAAFDAVLKFCAGLAGAIFALIALAICLNVILRNTGSGSLRGLLDAVEYGLLAATFLAAPWVLWKQAHVTVDLVTASLPTRVARPLARFVALLGFVVSGAFLWYATDAALHSAARGSMIRTAFVIPEWWALSAAPVGFVLICIEFLRQTLHPRLSRDMAGL
ncbi:TRAP transporter small permease [Aquicoccus sp.]|uniref:TRAP transporter small permease n=1 Tax=Aquicoccus sp. TaxID=2055851 RepID=UPI003564C840